MRKAKIILGIGLWIAVLPYLGFPYLFKNVLLSLSALLVAYIGFVQYKEYSKIDDKGDDEFENFSENKDFMERGDSGVVSETTEIILETEVSEN